MRAIIILIFVFVFAFVRAIPLAKDEERFIHYTNEYGETHTIDLWDNIIDETVSYSPDTEMGYFLYTRRNPTSPQQIRRGDVASLLASNYDPSKPVKFTVHGWTHAYTSKVNTVIRDAILPAEDVNVIAVDWSVGAQQDYIGAVRYVLEAGPSMAGFIDWLNENGTPFRNIHLLGHSLGGHLVGIAGRNCKRGTIEHITALDPANPLWGSDSQRIRKSDGKYVEVIHTNIGLLGMTDAVGHNDFYPNGGRFMAGCGISSDCSHDMVYYYVAEAFASGGFRSVQCMTLQEATSGVENCSGTRTSNMGGSAIKQEIGILGLNTNANSPFSMG